MTRIESKAGNHTNEDGLPRSWARWILLAILLIYVGVGVQYARLTPLWQVPDEPAHVNYALHVARTATLPVLKAGDYDAAYLERIKAAHFPPHMSVSSIRYESHQPPLYYLGAALLIRLFAPSALNATSSPALAPAVYTMRLYSLALSVVLLLVAYQILRRLFPNHPSLALGGVAFIAFIPQHLAMMAGANNDALAELVLALLLLRLVTDVDRPRGHRTSLVRGAILGMVLLTKTTVYLPALLAWGTFHLLNYVRSRWVSPFPLAQWVRNWLVEGAIGVLLALPFYVRNILVYGWPDFLGLRRHAEVVVGQMTTAEFVAREGWGALWTRALTWTFRSFWGQFGWMGVLMDARVYKALTYFSLVLLAAVLICVVRRQCLAPARALGLLAAAAAGTIMSYVGYNVSFLQHQGRYLFPMLIPLAAFIMPGLWMLLDSPRARWIALMAGLGGMLALAAAVVDLGPFDRWDALSLFALAVWFGLAWRWPRARPAWLLMPFLVLGGLALMALYGFILPALT